ncbi:MAG: hypothetical protein OXD46_10765 [Chloroflexi bacterium]|nr:hypothetical protein [Chloroflexota bacterium]
MAEGMLVKSIVVNSGKFLLQSLVWAIGLYWVATIAFLTAGLVALAMGWFPFSIESGPLGFMGYTMIIADSTNWSLGFEFNPLGFFTLFAAAGVLVGAGSLVRNRISSL